jgi:hypothetical protein
MIICSPPLLYNVPKISLYETSPTFQNIYYGRVCGKEYIIYKQYHGPFVDRLFPQDMKKSIRGVACDCGKLECIILPNVLLHGRKDVFIALPAQERVNNYIMTLLQLKQRHDIQNLYRFGTLEHDFDDTLEVLQDLDLLCNNFREYLTLFHYQEYEDHMHNVNMYVNMCISKFIYVKTQKLIFSIVNARIISTL